MVAGDQCTADLLGCNFGHVENDDGGDKSNTKTSDETTDNHDSESGRSSLKNATNREDQTSHDNRRSAANEISDITSNNGTEESTRRQDGCGERLLPRRQSKVLDYSGVWISSSRRIVETSVELDEVRHSQDTRHPSRIVSEKDTTERCKSTHEVGLDRHGRLNARRVGRTMNHNSTTWHCDGVQEDSVERG